MTLGHSRGSRSSMLDSRTRGAAVPCAPAVGSPTSSRSTFAWVEGSRPPAPTPMLRTVIAGWAPYDVAWLVSRAAPVGVHSSRSPGPAYDGTPRSSSATAGGGTGISPCAPCTRPEPTATVDTTSSSRPRCSSPAHTPTTSAIASRAPTSWKCTSAGDVPWTAASATASRSKAARARSCTASGRPDDASSASTSRQLRWVLLSATSTCTRVAAKPLRDTVSGVSATCSGATAATASASTSSGTPAPTRAPSSMSPLAPEEASTQPITSRPAGRRCGRPERRTRRRRTRCRC